jgi:hypothetical protein
MARYDSLVDIPWSAAGSENDWVKNMGVSSVDEHISKGDGSGRPARELFQSLEIYLLRSGYEAIVTESLGVTSQDWNAAERAAE